MPPRTRILRQRFYRPLHARSQPAQLNELSVASVTGDKVCGPGGSTPNGVARDSVAEDLDASRTVWFGAHSRDLPPLCACNEQHIPAIRPMPHPNERSLLLLGIARRPLDA